MSMLNETLLIALGGLNGPVYVDSEMVWNSSATAFVVPTPTLSPGDFMVAVCVSPTVSRTWSATGWTSVASVNATHSIAILKTSATGSDSFTFNLSGTNTAGLVFVYVCSGGTTVSGNNLAGATIANADPQVAASLSVTAGRLLLAVLEINNNSVTLASGPSGMTSRQTQFTNNTPRAALFDLAVVATGASGTKSFDLSASALGTAFLIEIQ